MIKQNEKRQPYKKTNPGLPVEKKELRAIRTALTPYVVKNYETK
jgi:hypothetical protein